MTRRNNRSMAGTTSLELVLFTFALITFIVLPIADMLADVAGCGLAQQTTEQITQITTSAASLEKVLDTLVSCSAQVLGSPAAGWLKLKPNGGYKNCGADLYLVETNIYTGAARYYPVDNIPGKLDRADNNYECCVQTKFQVGPFLELKYLPIEGFSKPLNLHFSAYKPFEQLDSLVASVSDNTTEQSTAASLTGNKAEWLGTATLSRWNYPVNWSQTTLPGQQITQSNTVTIAANDENWTDTHVLARKGKRIILVPSQGQVWYVQAGVPSNQALAGGWCEFWGDKNMAYSNGYVTGALLAKIGENGKPFYVTPSTNFVPYCSGELYLRCNDTTYQNNRSVQSAFVASCTN
ncbi:MAG TPA: hypothetical protein V6C97_36145 [Oculatellaceae cyanobacterium]